MPDFNRNGDQSSETKMEIAHLVTRVAAGDMEAESLLIEYLLPPLRMTLRKRSKDVELAEDLVQDTISILISRLRNKGLADPTRISGFAHRTALNVWVAHVRKEARRKTTVDSEEIRRALDESPGQLTSLIQREKSAAVRKLLKQLPQTRDREILKQTYLLQRDKAQVCDYLNLSSSQFDRVIYRAKKRLRVLVEQRGELFE